MHFRVLGPVEVFDGTRWRSVPAAKARALLAALLMEYDQVVSVDRLIEAVWGQKPPRTAASQVHTYVARLRKLLSDPDGRLLVTRPPGYQIVAGPRGIDVELFRSSAGTGHRLFESGDPQGAAAELAAALSLWRGRVFADVPSSLAVCEYADRLEEERLTSVEELIDAELACGRDRTLPPRLQELTRQHPLREHFWYQYMLALYRSGRQAEALATYRQVHRMLAEEMGVEPSALLRETHSRILASDATAADPNATTRTDAAPQSASPRSLSRLAPRQMPRDIPGFAGRAQALQALDALGDQCARGVPIGLVTGMPGVGKTSVAVHWSHRSADLFPDGQIFLGLQGYSATSPVRPDEALRRLLPALGVERDELPGSLEELADVYRSLLAGRRILLVLDNAADVTQVRPLLPGTPGCMVLVTSRDQQVGLIARDGATHVPLGVLDPAEALELLTEMLGTQSVARHRQATADLARLCAYLPLALRIAAANLQTISTGTVTDYLNELTSGDRLKLLAAPADPMSAVAAAFESSYRRLDPAARILLRRLGLHPGHDFDLAAAAALHGASPSECGQLLAVLINANLVEADCDRYRLHDLMREFAGARARAEESPAERESMAGRLREHYTSRAADAAAVAFGENLPPGRSPWFADGESAWKWLDSEHANTIMATRDSPEHLGLVSSALYRYLDVRANYAQAETLHSAALAAAVRAGDSSAEGRALNRLGVISLRRGEPEKARVYFEDSGAAAYKADDREGQAIACGNLGLWQMNFGNFDTSRRYIEAAVDLQGSAVGKARYLLNLGLLALFLGDSTRTIDLGHQAIELYRGAGNEVGLARALVLLGNAYTQAGEHRHGVACLNRALEIHRRLGNRMGEADAINALGNIFRETGDLSRAVDHHRQALEMHARGRHLDDEAEVLNDFGLTLAALNSADEARQRHGQALALAIKTGNRYEQARAHQGLGNGAFAKRIFEDLGLTTPRHDDNSVQARS